MMVSTHDTMTVTWFLKPILFQTNTTEIEISCYVACSSKQKVPQVTRSILSVPIFTPFCSYAGPTNTVQLLRRILLGMLGAFIMGYVNSWLMFYLLYDCIRNHTVSVGLGARDQV